MGWYSLTRPTWFQSIPHRAHGRQKQHSYLRIKTARDDDEGCWDLPYANIRLQLHYRSENTQQAVPAIQVQLHLNLTEKVVSAPLEPTGSH